MSEIEKMYGNANLISYYCGDGYIFDAMLEVECTNGDKEKCKTCDKAKTNYPLFTADKQIELIKWLIVHSPNTCLEDEIIVSAFEDSLANIINTIWQDLSEEEKQQVKGILE